MSFVLGKTRRQKQTAPPLRRTKPSWEISGQDRPEQPRWKVETDKHGKRTITELIPPPPRTDGFQSDSDRSRFRVELLEACLVGGNHANKGDLVICYNENAMMLQCRGKIISEERNAF